MTPISDLLGEEFPMSAEAVRKHNAEIAIWRTQQDKKVLIARILLSLVLGSGLIMTAIIAYNDFSMGNLTNLEFAYITWYLSILTIVTGFMVWIVKACFDR